MNLLEGMNRALDYIEANLDGEIDYTAVAKTAACSPYHFQRFFASVTDIPLSEYIRRRRLTMAALELQNTDIKIIDAALKYGYQSADAFSRAFAALHGLVPSKARAQGVMLKAYPRISFALSIKGVVALNYRIEERKDIRIVGAKQWFSTAGNYQLEGIPNFWSKLKTDGTAGTILSLMDGEPSAMLGICADMYNEGYDYWIAVPSSKPCPQGLSELVIPASTWAIFQVIGPMPTAMQETWGRIFSEWFPASGYQHAKSPELELYFSENTDSPSYKCEIWIPVVKK